MMEVKQIDEVKQAGPTPDALVYVLTNEPDDYVEYGCATCKGKFGIVAFVSEVEANEYRERIAQACHVKHLPLSLIISAAVAKPEPCCCVHVWYEGLVTTIECPPKLRAISCT